MSEPPPFSSALRRSLTLALRTYGELLLILVPTFVLVTLLKHTPAFPWMTERLAPAMSVFGLPGSAALPIILGLVVSLYAALAAMVGIGLTPPEITTLALMLGLCHNLIVEGAILFRLRTNPLVWTVVRLVMAVAAGLLLGRALGLGRP